MKGGLFLMFCFIYGVSPRCSVTPVQELLENGCINLRGLTVVSRSRGTVVNEKNCGDLQFIGEFVREPYFRTTNPTTWNSSKLYTVMVIDPDAPSTRYNLFYLHVIRANIPGSALKSRDCCLNQGNDYSKYILPTPPPGTGPHRYFCLVYEHEEGYLVQFRDAPILRPNFDLAAFLRGKGLCGPVAGTLFLLEILL